MTWDVFNPPDLSLDAESRAIRRSHLLGEIARRSGEQPVRRRSWRRRRLVVALAAAVVAALIVLPAMAVVQGWWFLGNGSPATAGEVHVVASGQAAGIEWTLTAFVSRTDGLCVALSPERPAGSGTQACGSAVRGEPNLPPAVANGPTVARPLR